MAHRICAHQHTTQTDRCFAALGSSSFCAYRSRPSRSSTYEAREEDGHTAARRSSSPPRAHRGDLRRSSNAGAGRGRFGVHHELQAAALASLARLVATLALANRAGSHVAALAASAAVSTEPVAPRDGRERRRDAEQVVGSLAAVAVAEQDLVASGVVAAAAGDAAGVRLYDLHAWGKRRRQVE